MGLERKLSAYILLPDVIQLYTVWRIFVNSINIKPSLNLHLGRKRERKKSETLINRSSPLGNNAMIKEHQERVFSYSQFHIIRITKIKIKT